MFRAVKLSVKTDYAARAVLELAGHPVDGPARKVEELATVVGTSANFLVQILIGLRVPASSPACAENKADIG